MNQKQQVKGKQTMAGDSRTNQALRGEDIIIYGNGHQTQCFCYMDELIEAIIRMRNIREDILCPENLRNLGEYTMLELKKC